MEAFLLLLGVAIGVLVARMAISRTPAPAPRADQPAEPEVPQNLRDPLTEAIEMIHHGVVVVDANGFEVFRNSAAEAIGSARDGRSLVESRLQELLLEALEGRTKRSTVELFGPPAQLFEVSAFPAKVESGDGALAMIEDRTEFRRTETIRRDFVANISHELKSPIGALGLLAETLFDETDPELRRRLAERMVTETARVSNTIDDLLELSRIEFGEDVQFEDLEVAAIVSEAVGRIQTSAEQGGVEICNSVGGGWVILGERRQLVSAIYNLLDNAVKYSDPGSRVRISTSGDPTGRFVRIDISDEGIGIPRRSLDRIFERFYRVDPARSRNTGGTGLGLAIVRHAAANHGGTVSAHSVEGQGSTFTLDLPMRPVLSPEPDQGSSMNGISN